MHLANYSHLNHCGWGWNFYHPYGIIFSVCTEGEKIQEERGIQIRSKGQHSGHMPHKATDS